MTDFVSWLALVVAVAGGLASYRLGRRAEFAVTEWMRELRGWAGDVIHVFSETRFSVVRDDSSEAAVRLEHARRLSALADIGRFYLPNQKMDQHGINKPSAYRGYRHAALDPLIAAVRVLESEPGMAPVPDSKILLELQREFVSAIFRILGPDHHNRVLGNMIRASHSSRRKDLTVGGLEGAADSLPQGATTLLEDVVKRIELAGSS